MADPRYQWKRFWVRRDGVFRMSPDGYLLDPEGEHGKLRNPDVAPYDAIADRPCLALLGDPGIGKTDALSTIVSERTATIGSDRVLAIDLRSHAEGPRLYRAIFESSQFAAWINSDCTLEIFLDSLDECLIHNRTVAALLVDEFQKYPVSRLRLRVACRAAEWPALLDDELPRIWGSENFGAYELVKLRRSDVAGLAKAYGVPEESFLAEVSRQDVAALAAVPVTLHLLLKLFVADSELPGRRLDLYEKGCLALCRESNLSRRASGAEGELSPDHRLLIAERIAAVTMFSKRVVISTGDEGSEAEFGVTLSQLTEDPDFIEGKRFDFSPLEVQEVLGTGLFTSLPHDRRIWTHWTFAEFLAARWVVNRNLTSEQVADLIFRPDVDGEDRVVPQLHETAAWLAAMRDDVMGRVVGADPQVLLRSTIAHTDPGTHARIVESLLRVFDEGRATDTDIELRRRYEVLSHPDLYDQLLPYITDRSKNVVVRRAAIDIGEACKVATLGNALLAITLDRSEDRQIRAQAAHAVARVGDANLKLQLQPLLDTTAEEDPDDELRGTALDALSDQLTGDKIFARVSRPRNPNLIGAYRYFLEYELPKRLRSADLPAALSWVANQRRDVDLDFALQRLVPALLDRAWSEIDAPGVLESLAEAVVTRLKQHDPILERRGSREAGKHAAEDPDKRWLLLKALVPKLRAEANRHNRVGLAHSGLVSSNDVPRLIEQLDAAEAEDKETWAQLIAYTFDYRIPGHYDVVFAAKDRHQTLAKEVGWWFETIYLDSPIAEKMRADYAEQLRWQREVEPKKPTHPPIPQIVAGWLAKIESGDMSAWWRLNLDMTLDPDSDRYGEEFESDLTSLPAWQQLDESLRHRCIAAGERYLREADPHTSEWLGTNTFYRPAAAGYRALALLVRCKPDSLASFSVEVWRKWAPIVIAYPDVSRGDEDTLIMRSTYLHAPDAVIDAVRVLITKENGDHGTVFVTRKLAGCWDRALTSALLHKVRWDYELKPAAIRELLSEILGHDGKEAINFALSLAEDRQVEFAVRVQAAVALVSTIPGQVWNRLWGLIQEDPDLCREVFLKFAHQPGERHGGSILQHLTEEAVADLYLWLANRFPHREDPEHKGPLAHYVGERESVGDFRDGLLRYLTEKGTPKAVGAVRQIAAQLGNELEWLKYVALRADVARLRQTWEGIPPEALFRLAQNPEARVVEDESQLLEVVCQSLGRLQAKLHGAPPAVTDLWNDDGTPKDEMHLSDYVQRHLTEDLAPQRGLVANREVRIRPGEATDIYVAAMRKDPRTEKFHELTTIVETKGCWNRGLRTDMENQLKKRYLCEQQCEHGLYLVGWFRCDRWSRADYRLADTPKWTLDKAREFFETQAEELSDPTTTLRAFVLDAALR